MPWPTGAARPPAQSAPFCLGRQEEMEAYRAMFAEQQTAIVDPDAAAGKALPALETPAAYCARLQLLDSVRGFLRSITGLVLALTGMLLLFVVIVWGLDAGSSQTRSWVRQTASGSLVATVGVSALWGFYEIVLGALLGVGLSSGYFYLFFP